MQTKFTKKLREVTKPSLRNQSFNLQLNMNPTKCIKNMAIHNPTVDFLPPLTITSNTLLNKTNAIVTIKVIHNVVLVRKSSWKSIFHVHIIPV